VGILYLEKIAKEQEELSELVIRDDDFQSSYPIVTGVDVSYAGHLAVGCAVISNIETHSFLEIITNKMTIESKYISGFFQLREGPILLDLLHSIENPGILLVDGNGILHPRRFGLASYLGLKCDIPTIGVAKNLMIGELCSRSGNSADIIHNDQIVGKALWLGKKKPVYVSIGHRISLDSAVRVVKESCIDDYPAVLRQAHLTSDIELRKL
jgi:deoxyribonuclease V